MDWVLVSFIIKKKKTYDNDLDWRMGISGSLHILNLLTDFEERGSRRERKKEGEGEKYWLVVSMHVFTGWVLDVLWWWIEPTTQAFFRKVSIMVEGKHHHNIWRYLYFLKKLNYMIHIIIIRKTPLGIYWLLRRHLETDQGLYGILNVLCPK